MEITMKKTKIIRDGFIVGVGNAQIDPESTKKVIEGDLNKSTEMKELKKNKITSGSLLRTNRSAIGNDYSVFFKCAKRIGMSGEEMKVLINYNPAEAESKLDASEITERKVILEGITKRNKDIVEIQKKQKKVYGDLEKKRVSLVKEKAVYFESENEPVIEDNEASEIIKLLGKLKTGEKLSVDMKVISPKK
jgi:hypothetical protein